jgi:hypothetical protein
MGERISMKQTSGECEFSINDYCVVRLTEAGEAVWARHWGQSGQTSVPEAVRSSATLQDGRVRFQIHELMNIFGSALYLGSMEHPFDGLLEFIDSRGTNETNP